MGPAVVDTVGIPIQGDLWRDDRQKIEKKPSGGGRW
jgi:hypothetical protein